MGWLRSIGKELHKPVEDCVRRFFLNIVAARNRATNSIRTPFPPSRQDIIVKPARMALRTPQYLYGHIAGHTVFPIRRIHLQILGRAGAIIFTRSKNRFLGEAAYIFLERFTFAMGQTDAQQRRPLAAVAQMDPCTVSVDIGGFKAFEHAVFPGVRLPSVYWHAPKQNAERELRQ